MRRAVVLSGGGSRGAFQVGMLRELITGDRRLDFQIIRGVSVGSLNAAFLAQAPARPESQSQAQLARKVDELEALWRTEIKGNHSIYANRGGFVGIVAGADSLYSVKPFRRLVDKHVSIDEIKSSGRDFAVGTVSLVSGLYQEWRAEAPRFFERLIASSSIPVIFPYVDIPDEEDVLVDGGVRNITPLSSAFRADPPPDEVYVLLASRVERTADDKLPPTAAEVHRYEQWDDNWLGTKVGGLDVLQRTIDLLSDEIYLDDIRGALDWNGIVGSIQKVHEAARNEASISATLSEALAQLKNGLDRVKKRHVPINVIAPRKWFNDSEDEPGKQNPSTEFSPTLIADAIEHGKEIARDPNQWVWPPATSA